MRPASRPAVPARRPIRLALLGAAMALAACSVPVAGGLDDAEANRVFVALDRASLDATKEPDGTPGGEGKWRVTVARDDLPRALSALREEDLPRREPPGLADAVGKGSLVPSEAAEHAQLVAGVAGELERSLEGVEGILQARVHLNVPAPTPLSGLRDGPISRGSAGVLLEHRGATPPISADSVQRLIAGAVPGLVPGDVVVVMVPRSSPAFEGDAQGSLAHVGPIAVARASMRQLQAALAVLVALVAALAGATLVLYSRLARARAGVDRDPRELPPNQGAF